MLTIIFLVQVIIYLLIFLVNDYFGTVLSLVLGGVSLALWLLSHLVELVERSRVSKRYYRFMLICFLAPALALLAYGALRGGFGWMTL